MTAFIYAGAYLHTYCPLNFCEQDHWIYLRIILYSNNSLQPWGWLKDWLALVFFHFLSVGYNRVSFGMNFNINIHLCFNTWTFMLHLPVESHLFEFVTSHERNAFRSLSYLCLKRIKHLSVSKFYSIAFSSFGQMEFHDWISIAPISVLDCGCCSRWLSHLQGFNSQGVLPGKVAMRYSISNKQ